MKPRLVNIITIVTIVSLCLLLGSESVYGQRSQYSYPYSSNQSAYQLFPDTADSLSPVGAVKNTKKRPWLAAGEVFALNIGVWLFDLYILDQDYARITLNSMKQNLKTGFVWDNDNFSINLLSHPYHGSLYFNSARSNGMNFWESVPFTFGGSLMWELFMETEPPSINDLFSTTIGGVALGEVTFRLSSLILDDSERGGNRVLREFFGAVASPMRTVNRFSRGELTKRYAQNSFEHERSPFNLSVGVGWRYLAKNNYLFQGDHGMYVDFALDYGDPFYNDTYKPFDYFSLKAMINIIGGQPIVGSVNAMGMLWGRSDEPLPGHDMTIGVFQHFDFYQTSKLKKSEVVPFEISQSAAIGGGLLYKFPQIGNKINMSYNVFANAIIMGGSYTDHLVIEDRDYNMGSGFSLKLQTKLEFNRMASFFVGVEHYRLFTWKGYPNEPAPIPPGMNIIELNAQGNKGHTELTIINPRLDLNLSSNLQLSLCPYIYLRDSHYKYFDDVSYRTFETRFSLTYKF